MSPPGPSGGPPSGGDRPRERFEAERERQRELRELAELIREDLAASILRDVQASGIREEELAAIVRDAVRSELASLGIGTGSTGPGTRRAGTPAERGHGVTDSRGGAGHGPAMPPSSGHRQADRGRPFGPGELRRWLPILAGVLFLGWIGACSGWMPWSGNGTPAAGPVPGAVGDSAETGPAEADSTAVDPAETGTGATPDSGAAAGRDSAGGVPPSDTASLTGGPRLSAGSGTPDG